MRCVWRLTIVVFSKSIVQIRGMADVEMVEFLGVEDVDMVGHFDE